LHFFFAVFEIIQIRTGMKMIHATGLLVKISSLSILIIEPARADIIPDVSLDSRVTGRGNETLIEGGAKAGRNLFHSFQDFSLSSGETARFMNDPNLLNLITRITGRNPSLIEGNILVNGGTNVFFINPNGIVFGPNARLQIGGSFMATTATSLGFADGSFFPAQPNASQPPLLTISNPTRALFAGTSGPITILGPGHLYTRSNLFEPVSSIGNPNFSVSPNQALAFIANSIQLNGANLYSLNGHILLGSLKSGALNFDLNLGNLTAERGSLLADLWLSNASSLNVRSFSQGNLSLIGANIDISSGSTLLHQSFGPLPGQINLLGSESLTIQGLHPLRILNASIYSQGLGGPGASIVINSPKISILNSGSIVTNGFLSNPGGSINITSESIFLDGATTGPTQFTASIISGVFSGGGDITINTKDYLSLNGGITQAATIGDGTGGSLFFKSEKITLSGISILGSPSLITTSTYGSGKAGTLTINTKDIDLFGGFISSTTFARGNAGQVFIESSGTIRLSSTPTNPDFVGFGVIGSAANEAPETVRQLLGITTQPQGNAGDLFLRGNLIFLSNNAVLSVINQGSGDSGTLQVRANQIFLQNKGGILASTINGSGGDIDVNAKLIYSNQGRITASARGNGIGGNILLDSSLIVFNSSTVTADTEQLNAGKIEIFARGLLQDRSTTITATSAQGSQFDGEVRFFTPNNEILRASAPPVPAPGRPSVGTACPVPGQPSSFTNTGAGGLPKGSNGNPLSPSMGWQDSTNTILSQNQVADPVIAREALGMIAQGDKIVLSADLPGSTTTQTSTNPMTCNP
jgi:filamentous hemagglutinin family protein